MAITVQGPGGVSIQFPDGTDNATIDGVMRQHFGGEQPAPAVPRETPPAQQPLWDPIGDIGRSVRQSAEAIPPAFNKAFPSAQDQLAQDAANRQKYGAIGGAVKGALIDPVARLGSAASIPASALGVVASPLTGLLHGTVGSLMGEGLNAVDRAMGTKPGTLTGDNKAAADRGVDLSLMGIGPAGMEGGAVGIGNAADAASAATAQENLAKNAATTAKSPIFSQARDAGYKISPAEVDPNSMGARLAGESGKIKTAQLASAKNQAVTNNIAAQELGLPAGTVLDETTFDSVRGSAANAYKAIENSAAKLPTGRVVADNEFLTDISGLDSRSADFIKDFPEAAAKRSEGVRGVQDSVLKKDFSPKSAIEMIRNVLVDARVNLKNWADADKIRLGKAQRDAADAIENLMDRNLSAAGETQAVTDYRTARATIAKAHDIEAATDAAGNVSARKIAALSDKRPLSGGLKTIADVASAFPRSMQNPTAFGGYHATSALDFMGRAAAGIGAGVSGQPAVAALALAPEVRMGARSLALSDMFQNRLLPQRPLNSPWPGIGQTGTLSLMGNNAIRNGAQPLLPLQNQPQRIP